MYRAKSLFSFAARKMREKMGKESVRDNAAVIENILIIKAVRKEQKSYFYFDTARYSNQWHPDGAD